MTLHLAILDDYQLASKKFAPWRELGEVGIEATHYTKHFDSTAVLLKQLEPYEILVVMRERTPFSRHVLKRLPNLRLLVTTGMANSSIDLMAAQDLGIEVRGTGGSAAAAPELTWALLMALVRNIPAEESNLRDGRWQQHIGSELSGKTLGVLGLGRIGRTITRYAQAFEMDVIAWSPNLTTEQAHESGARLVSKHALFKEAEIVTIHLRLSERSRNIVGAEELRLLGPSGYLINTARGAIVDEEALLEALTNGTIAGAGIDVYNEEPLDVGSRWVNCPRTVLTPHLGYVTKESYQRYYGEALENIRAWVRGEHVRVLTTAPAIKAGANRAHR